MLSFGLCNGPAIFSSLMDITLQGLAWETCLAYENDVLIFAQDWVEKITHLDQVLGCIEEARLKLNPKKCQLARQKVTIIGHQVSAEGLHTDLALLQSYRTDSATSIPKGAVELLGLD